MKQLSAGYEKQVVTYTGHRNVLWWGKPVVALNWWGSGWWYTQGAVTYFIVLSIYTDQKAIK